MNTDCLMEALDNISAYREKIIVVKYGGNAMINEELKLQVMQDIAALSKAGLKIVLVHGGGPDINGMLAKIGKEPAFVDGLRVTDAETIEIVQMVLAGKVNKSLVNLLGKEGVKAVGISGIDAKMLKAEVKDERLGYVGKVIEINIDIITDLLDKGYVPVVSTIACDDNGNAYNINGDTAAAELAGALDAEKLIMMTDISGVLRDFHDTSTLISHITVPEAEQLKKDGIVSGGMIPKVDCCIKAVMAGVKHVKITDGRVPHVLIMEVLSNECGGTDFTED